MRNVRIILLAAAALAVVACGRNDDDAFVEGTPDSNGLALEITGGADEGVDEAALTGASQKQGVGGEPIEYLQNARAALKYLNGTVKQALTPLVELVNSEKAQNAANGTVKIYGPKDKDGATFKLAIKKVSDDTFAWRLQAKPLGGDDAQYVVVMAGRMVKGAEPHRGHGVMGVSLDALKSVDATFPGQGKLFVGFGQSDKGKVLVYRLKDFTPDASQWDPVTATFVGHRLLPSKATRIRIASYYNLAASPTAAKEFVRSRIRFIPGVGGRADLLATGGDVPAGKVYFGSACWDASESEGFAILRECVQGDPSTCTVIATRGQLSNCKPGLENEAPPPPDENSVTLEDDAPEQAVIAPEDMPSGEE